jgi:hypothetical protein
MICFVREQQDLLLHSTAQLEGQIQLPLDRCAFLPHLEVEFLSSNRPRLVVDELESDEITAVRWSKIGLLLKGIRSDVKTRHFHPIVLPNSVIMRGVPAIMGEFEEKKRKWILLYSG